MSNEEVLAKARMKRKLVETIRKRQLDFFGHALRKEELADVAVTGKIKGNEQEEGRSSRSSKISATGWRSTKKR